MLSLGGLTIEFLVIPSAKHQTVQQHSREHSRGEDKVEVLGDVNGENLADAEGQKAQKETDEGGEDDENDAEGGRRHKEDGETHETDDEGRKGDGHHNRRVPAVVDGGHIGGDVVGGEGAHLLLREVLQLLVAVDGVNAVEVRLGKAGADAANGRANADERNVEGVGALHELAIVECNVNLSDVVDKDKVGTHDRERREPEAPQEGAADRLGELGGDGGDRHRANGLGDRNH